MIWSKTVWSHHLEVIQAPILIWVLLLNCFTTVKHFPVKATLNAIKANRRPCCDTEKPAYTQKWSSNPDHVTALMSSREQTLGDVVSEGGVAYDHSSINYSDSNQSRGSVSSGAPTWVDGPVLRVFYSTPPPDVARTAV